VRSVNLAGEIGAPTLPQDAPQTTARMIREASCRLRREFWSGEFTLDAPNEMAAARRRVKFDLQAARAM